MSHVIWLPRRLDDRAGGAKRSGDGAFGIWGLAARLAARAPGLEVTLAGDGAAELTLVIDHPEDAEAPTLVAWHDTNGAMFVRELDDDALVGGVDGASLEKALALVLHRFRALVAAA